MRTCFFAGWYSDRAFCSTPLWRTWCFRAYRWWRACAKRSPAFHWRKLLNKDVSRLREGSSSNWGKRRDSTSEIHRVFFLIKPSETILTVFWRFYFKWCKWCWAYFKHDRLQRICPFLKDPCIFGLPSSSMTFSTWFTAEGPGKTALLRSSSPRMQPTAHTSTAYENFFDPSSISGGTARGYELSHHRILFYSYESYPPRSI